MGYSVKKKYAWVKIHLHNMACVQETYHQSIQAGHLKGSDAATAGNLLYFSCVTIALFFLFSDSSITQPLLEMNQWFGRLKV